MSDQVLLRDHLSEVFVRSSSLVRTVQRLGHGIQVEIKDAAWIWVAVVSKPPVSPQKLLLVID